jgi:hypothetical protein
MALKPEMSVAAGLATAALVFGIYQNVTPTIADIRASQPHDDTIASTERMASWTAASAVAGISLISKDPTIFILGSAMIVAMSWMHRHANTVSASIGMPTPLPTMHAVS